MDAVLGRATRCQRRRTLLKMTNGFCLDDAYGATLVRIKEQGGGRDELGVRVLMWVLCSERPLKAEELCLALGVEAGTTDLDVENVPTTRTLMSCTLGLVSIDEPGSTVRLVHFTLREYLEAQHNLFTTPHSVMAEICLTYLNFPSICWLPAPNFIPSMPPFLHYASCYWGFHARKGLTQNVECLALQLLRRDANHISAAILVCEESVDFLSWWDRSVGSRPNLSGFTGLHCIAYMGITEIAIGVLKMKRWDLNGRDSNGATPLMWAAKYGNYTLVELLLGQGGVDPTLSDNHGLTPLSHAAKSGCEGIVKLLLERMDVNPDSPDKGSRTPLSYAARFGHENVVKLLLETEGVNPDSPDQNRRTPLSYAAGSGHEGVVEVLLERGDVNPDSSRKPSQISRSVDFVNGLLGRWIVSPDTLDEGIRTPLSYAAESGCEGIVRLLLKREDVDPSSLDGNLWTPLSYAAGSGHESVAKLFLERGDVNPNSSDKDHRTPLSYAAASGYEGIVEMLLERKDVWSDLSDDDHRTPLSYAAESGHDGVAKLLLEGQDVDHSFPSWSGRTPLSYAAGSGHEGMAKLLLERGGFRLDAPDGGSRTPLSFAAGFGHEGVVKMFLQRGDVNPDLSDWNGRTPLSYAAQSGSEGVVNLLLNRGDVDLGSSDINDLTALQYAKQSGHIGTMRLLSAPRPFIYRASRTGDLKPEIASPPLSSQGEAKLDPLLQREGVAHCTRHEAAETTSLLPPDHETELDPISQRQSITPDIRDEATGAIPLPCRTSLASIKLKHTPQHPF